MHDPVVAFLVKAALGIVIPSYTFWFVLFILWPAIFGHPDMMHDFSCKVLREASAYFNDLTQNKKDGYLEIAALKKDLKNFMFGEGDQEILREKILSRIKRAQRHVLTEMTEKSLEIFMRSKIASREPVEENCLTMIRMLELRSLIKRERAWECRNRMRRV